jgi:hypothetical protein
LCRTRWFQDAELALDDPAESGGAPGPVAEGDLERGAERLHVLRMKLFAVIHDDHGGDPEDGPRMMGLVVVQRVLEQDAVAHAQHDGDGAGWVEAQTVAPGHARVDVKPEREPGAAQGAPSGLVDELEVQEGVVDLHHMQGVGGGGIGKSGRGGEEPGLVDAPALTAQGRSGRRDPPEKPIQRATRWHEDPLPGAGILDRPHRVRLRGSDRGEVLLLDDVLQHLLRPWVREVGLA